MFEFIAYVDGTVAVFESAVVAVAYFNKRAWGMQTWAIYYNDKRITLEEFNALTDSENLLKKSERIIKLF